MPDAAVPVPPLSLRLFGPFEAQVQGRPLPPLHSRKHLGLLALLTLRHGREVQRAWLAGTLWPESTEPAAFNSLRQGLVDVRRALGSQAYRLQSPTTRTLCLDLNDASVDLLDFDAAIAVGDRAALERAVLLYRGPLLEGSYEEWVLAERTAREQGYLQAREALAEQALAVGESATAVRHLQQVLVVDGLRERAYARLMAALAASGDYAGVIQVYRDLRLRLHRELHAEPNPSTTALFEQIRQQARTRATQGARALPAVGATRTAVSAPDQEVVLSPLAESLSVSTVTLLFTDIEGSTPLWETHPDAMRGALLRHNALLHAHIEGQDGEVFKLVGDGVCALFPTAEAALAAAVSAQQALQQEGWPPDAQLKVRMALHTGAVERREGDCLGPTVNRVARLLGIGHGGQIVLSATTQALVGDRLPAGVWLEDQGRHRLKGLEQPMGVFAVRHPALAGGFASLRSLDAFPHNLPHQLTSFIGREEEMAEVKSLLRRSRLLTLTGSGGCGKTRLALEVAAELVADYSEGVWLVELASLSDPALVAQTVASVVGVREVASEPILTTLISALKARQMLLLLDNCEHLLEACTFLTDTLLRRCPHLTILTTSREALNVAGEQPWRVPPMQHPQGAPSASEEKGLAAILLEYDACRLFVERARVQRPEFVLTGQNAVALAQLCQRLDGIPLAIEMAAARVRSLPLAEITSRLDQRFSLLTGGSRTALPRQQTLRALIDWSYDLLTVLEQQLLQRLSVFAGGWTLEAAEAVCAGVGCRVSGVEDANSRRIDSHHAANTSKPTGHATPDPRPPTPDEVLDLLTSLVDKSLVGYEERDGAARYRLLETVRQYARDRLLESGESDLVQERHLDYFLWLSEAAEPKLEGAAQGEWLQRLEAEHENLRGALEWSLSAGGSRGGLRLCGALWLFWRTRGHLSEGREWCVRALGTPGGEGRTQERAKALNGLGRLAREQGDYAPARASYEESLTIYREIGDRNGIASALYGLGYVVSAQGDYPSARAYYEKCLTIYREIGDRRGIANSLNGLGIVAYFQGDYPSERAYYEESLALFREIGDRSGIADALNNLGIIACDQGDYASARASYEESLTIDREIGDRNGIAYSLNNLGYVVSAQGDYPSARAYYEESLTILREIEDRRGIANSLLNLGNVAFNQGDYPTARGYYDESLALFKEIGDRSNVALSFEAFASLAVKESRSEQAAMLWGAAEALREEIGSPLPPSAREAYDRDVAEVRQALGEEAFSAAWTKGRAMTLEQTVANVLEEANGASSAS